MLLTDVGAQNVKQISEILVKFGKQANQKLVSISLCLHYVLIAELYDFCIREGYADKNLIAKWKKQGYENLCCLRCIQPRDTNFGTNCICRVPKGKLEEVRQ